MSNLYNWIFWFNPYEELWYVIEKDSYLTFFNGNREKAKYYKSKDHSTLMYIVSKPEIVESFEDEKYNATQTKK
jgi:hypothetical protein